MDGKTKSERIYESLKSSTNAFCILLTLNAFCYLILLALEIAGVILIGQIEYGKTVNLHYLKVVEFVESIAELSAACTFLSAGIAFLAWLKQARSNINAFGIRDLKYNGIWVTGGFILPVVCWYQLPLIMSETWRASNPDILDAKNWKTSLSTPLVGWWWLFWILQSIVGLGASFSNSQFRNGLHRTLSDSSAYQMACGLNAFFMLMAAAVLAAIVRQIALRQELKQAQISVVAGRQISVCAPQLEHSVNQSFFQRNKQNVCYAVLTILLLFIPITTAYVTCQNPDFDSYMANTKRRIRANWNPPGNQQSRRVIVNFKVHEDGKISDLGIERSCGDSAMDRAAIKAIGDTQLDPLPIGSPSTVDIQFTLDYNVYPKSNVDKQKSSGRNEIWRTVHNLGMTDRNLSDELEQLESDPHVAVRSLVAELHPIPRKLYYEKIRTNDSRHVLACLRALHYLTGVTFTAASALQLTDDEKQFLDFKDQMHDSNPDHRLHFFGVWMSRNADYVAPVDAQQKIIRQWKQWQTGQGDGFSYTPSRRPKDCMDDWYWFG